MKFKDVGQVNELYTKLSTVLGLIKNPETFKKGIGLVLGKNQITVKLVATLEQEFVAAAVNATISTLSSIQEPEYANLQKPDAIKKLYAVLKGKLGNISVTKPVTDFVLFS